MEVIEIIGFRPNEDLKQKMPFFKVNVSAGFPNIPVDNEIEREIDLNELLVEHPAATFFAKVHGLNMQFAGIRDGDILIVDSAVEPLDGKIILALIKNDLTVKIFREIDGEIYLETQNHHFLPLVIGEVEFNIIGVVTKIIHSVK
jgi:DNA polymerase V